MRRQGTLAPALGRPLAAALVALSVLLALLTVSGLLLAVAYRPAARPPPGWEPAPRPRLPLPDAVVSAAAGLHRVAAVLALAAGVAVLCLAVARATRRAVARLLAVALAVALVGGLLLPWDALVVWGAYADRGFAGYLWVAGPAVRSVVQGGAELSPATIGWLLGGHTAAAAVAVAACLPVARGRAGPRPGPEVAGAAGRSAG